MGTIYIDGKPYKADPEQNLLHACLSLGFDLPYFCWHAALGSVGACRQCAVEAVQGCQGYSRQNRHGLHDACRSGDPHLHSRSGSCCLSRGIIEGMMLNHPHDCPVCDEGGECHLQDMTVMTGHDYRRTRFDKRTFHNQYLGPFVYHEMNRCIQCYRCVRFYRQYAGGNDLNSFGIRNAVYFGRDEDGVLESEFAGNLVEVCPTGVFTDRTLRRHYTRKWDLRMAPSICAHCGVGCNMTIGRALWAAAPGLDPVQQRGERLLPLRPRAFWLRVRKQRPADSRRKARRRVYFERGGGAPASVSHFERQAADRYRLAQSVA